jgi:hypothetical protein
VRLNPDVFYLLSFFNTKDGGPLMLEIRRPMRT